MRYNGQLIHQFIIFYIQIKDRDHTMREKKISEIFFTNEPWKLTKSERKTHILINVIIGIPTLFIASYIFGYVFKLYYLPFFFALSLFLVAWILYVYCWDNLNVKYGLKPTKSSFPYSYQGYVILFTLSAPAFFCLGLALGFDTGNFWFGFGGAVAIVYPVFGMFLRIGTFNEDSLPYPESSGERSLSDIKKYYGYMPLSYWILAVALGFFTVGRGFSGIHLYLVNGYPSLEAAIFAIIIGLLVQTVYSLPDKLNRIVPIDLRTKNGFWFMFILAFVLFGVSQWLIEVVTNLT